MSLSAPQAISVVLDAASGVTDIRSDRYFIGLNLAPGNTQTPYQYAVHRDRSPIRHMNGDTGFHEHVVDIESYADTATQCIALAEATRAALDEYAGTVTSGSDSFEFIYIKLEDESNVIPIQIPGREQGVAVIRQAYQLMQKL